MTKTFMAIVSAIRAFCGWDDASETRLSPPHGWLLPVAADLRAQRVSAASLRADRSQRRPAPRG